MLGSLISSFICGFRPPVKEIKGPFPSTLERALVKYCIRGGHGNALAIVKNLTVRVTYNDTVEEENDSWQVVYTAAVHIEFGETLREGQLYDELLALLGAPNSVVVPCPFPLYTRVKTGFDYDWYQEYEYEILEFLVEE